MISPKIIYYFLQPFSFLHLFQNKKTKMVTKNFLPRLKLLRWIEHITVEKVVSFSWWGQSERVKIKFIFPHLNHATQCVPLPEASSKFKIAHSFLLGRVGKVSLKKTPRKFFKPIFFAASSISKLLRGLFGKTIFSTWISIYSKRWFPVSGIPNSSRQTFCMFHSILISEKESSQTHLQKFNCLTTLSKPCFESS